MSDCAARIAHASKADALAHINRPRAKFHGTHGRHIPYECEECGLWHIRSDGKAKRALRAKSISVEWAGE